MLETFFYCAIRRRYLNICTVYIQELQTIVIVSVN